MELPRLGTVIAGKYKLTRKVGRGGMGVVFEARHVKLAQRVAIKFMRPEHAETTAATMRFEREARAASRLTSPHALRVIDIDTLPNGLPYMISEFLEGRDLGTILSERRMLPVSEAVDWILQACMAVSEAHRLGVIHRDLKPSNLFFCTTAHGDVVKVVDFGVSKLLDESSTPLTENELIGTPQYMAPEQLKSASTVDGRADVWSLGVILYRTLTGTHPYHATTHVQLMAAVLYQEPRHILEHAPSLPPDLANIVMSTLVRDPNMRVPSAAALFDLLSPFGTWRPPESRPRISDAALATPSSTSVVSAPSSVASVEANTEAGLSSDSAARRATQRRAFLFWGGAASVIVLVFVSAAGATYLRSRRNVKTATPPMTSSVSAPPEIPETPIVPDLPTTAPTTESHVPSPPPTAATPASPSASASVAPRPRAAPPPPPPPPSNHPPAKKVDPLHLPLSGQ